MSHSVLLFLALGIMPFQFASADVDKGIGPITDVKLDVKIDEIMAGKGKAVFATKCSACHKMEERYVGPALKGTTTRRSPEWIMNMILNPAEMIEKNETAKDLFGEYLVPMAFQNVSKEDARTILEFLRSSDSKAK